MRTAEIRTEALRRATDGQSLANYPAIILGFTAKGIPEADILPRINVLTFEAWKAVGRHVRKGEHGVRIVTVITTEKKDDQGNVTEAQRRPWHTTVFHISQTDPEGTP
jgi:hypothetical protein